MDERTTALVRLSASLTGDEAGQVEAMDRAAAADATGAEEVLLQSYLFLGFPVALNALWLWRRRAGIPPTEGSEPEDLDSWRRRGEEVCGAVYADHYDTLREVMGRIHPDLGRWAVMEGYGKVLGRPGLDLLTRELCIAALLAGTTASRQLHSHLRGCLNVGASMADVERMLAEVSDLIGPERAREAGRVWARVRARQNGNGES